MKAPQTDCVYRKRFDLLSKRTDEYSKLQRLIVRKIIPLLPKTDALLDIGAGRGNLTLQLSKHFTHMGIVEPNQAYCHEVVKKALLKGKVVTAYCGAWQHAEIGSQLYDLILCVHVLYYVEKPKWASFVHKMSSHLTPGGKMVIVLVSRFSQINELYQRFLSKEQLTGGLYSEEIIECLRSSGYKFEASPLESIIATESLEEFLEIAALILHENAGSEGTLHLKDQVSFINGHFRTDHGYRIVNSEHVIVVDGQTQSPKHQ